MVKYRVHEVSKDLNIPGKDLMEFLTKYSTEPKNHMAALETADLDLIFDHYTRQHEVPSLLVYFSAFEEEIKAAEERKKSAKELAAMNINKAPAKPAVAEKSAEKTPAEKPVDEKISPAAEKDTPTEKATDRFERAKQAAITGKPVVEKPKKEERVKKPSAEKPAAAAPSRPAGTGGTSSPAPFQKREKTKAGPTYQASDRKVRVVDTKTSTVDLSRYDERIINMVSDRDMDRSRKQKLKKTDNRGYRSNKRISEEQRRMKMETHKPKKPSKIVIPEELAVNELAAKLMVTNAEVVKN